MTQLSDYNNRKRQAMLDALRNNKAQPHGKRRAAADPFDPAYRVTRLAPDGRAED